MHASAPLRPAIKTPRPRIYGPQTAIVTGPEGEEIHTDLHGRVKVFFHWDRLSSHDETSSCWVRVAQAWSGPNWGTWFLPRIGMEVVVEFLDGNPDRPLITGCVYNGANGTPYSLPEDKTKSTIKSNSSPGGDGFNELRFEDAKGSEEIFFHAQKDHNEVVLNDRTQNVGRDRTIFIGHNHQETILNDKTILVEGHHGETILKDMTLLIEGYRSCSITKDHSEMISGYSSQTVVKDKSAIVEGNFDTRCNSALSTSVQLSTTHTSGKDFSISTDKNLNLNAAKDISQRTGKKMSMMAGDNLAISTDKNATIAAADQLVIKVGKAKIVMKKNGDIFINGAKIDVKGSGAVTIKGTNIDNN